MPPTEDELNTQIAEAPSLEEGLGAFWDAAESDAGAALPTASVAQPGERPAAAPAPAPPAQQSAAPAMVRGPDGKFVAKAPEPQQATPKTEPNAPQLAGEALPAPIAPPATWSATAKAKFTALDPEIQAEVLKREKDMDTGRAQWEQGAARLNRLDSVLAPRRDQFALAGSDEASYVGRLLTAEDALRRAPVDGLVYLGQQYGVNWQALIQRVTGQPGGQPAQPMHPALQQIGQQVQTLTQTVQQQQAAASQAQRDQVAQEISAFAADPANLYYENVRADMAELFQASAAAGKPISLRQAYDRAVWGNDTIRPLLIQAQAADQQRKAADEAKAKTAAARQASGSVTGSPTPGARTPPGPKGTLVDALSQAWDEQSA